MANKKFLDQEGLQALVTNIKSNDEATKSYIGTIPIDAVDGEGNPYTDVVSYLSDLMSKKMSSDLWIGTQEEFEAAAAAGLIADNTVVHITNDYDEPQIKPISNAAIKNLFEN